MEKEMINIVELMMELKEGDKTSAGITSFTDYNESEYICDVVGYIADSQINIRKPDLLEWASVNEWYIDQVLEEFNEKDFYKVIQRGQYLAIQEEMYDNWTDFIAAYAYDQIINGHELDEITSGQFEEITDNLESVDDNDCLDAIVDIVKAALEREEEEEDD